jgi:hypothetical protein
MTKERLTEKQSFTTKNILLGEIVITKEVVANYLHVI